jgi:hypothetical protein
MDHEKRSEAAWVWMAVPAVLVALGQAGFLFEIPTLIGIAVVLTGSVIAGMLRGEHAAARLAYAGAFVVCAVGITLATRWYVADRETIVSYELCIPGLLGVLPGVGVYLLVKRWDDARIA